MKTRTTVPIFVFILLSLFAALMLMAVPVWADPVYDVTVVSNYPACADIYLSLDNAHWSERLGGVEPEQYVYFVISPHDGYQIMSILAETDGTPPDEIEIEIIDNRSCIYIEDANVTLTVNLEHVDDNGTGMGIITNHQITYADMTNGSVAYYPYINMPGAQPSEWVIPGRTVELTVTPDSGHVLEPGSLTVVTCDNYHASLYVTKVDETTYSFNMPNSDVLVSASFPYGGECGAGLSWFLKDGTLKIYGEGDMYEFASYAATPWSGIATQIETLSLGEGITSIGAHAFENLALQPVGYLSVVTLPAGVTRIGEAAFRACSLSTVQIPGSVTMIGARAFQDNINLSVYYGGTGATWDSIEKGEACFDSSMVLRAIGHSITVIDTFNGHISSPPAALPGETVVLTVDRLQQGWGLDTLTVTAGGSAVAYQRTGEFTYTFTMPNADVTVKATFRDNTQDPQVLYAASSGTLYFINSRLTYSTGDTYDGQTLTKVWRGAAVTSSPDNPGWTSASVKAGVTSVVFDEEFRYVHPVSTARWFNGLANLTSITGLEYLNTAAVTSAKEMFRGCSNMAALRLNNFDTSSVTDMSGMFREMSGLTELEIGEGFDTSSVTTMRSMFYSCSSLTEINFKAAETSSVTDMAFMFYGCAALRTLRISSEGFDTSAVTDMSSMFNGCSSLGRLDLRFFDTRNVTSMRSMFCECNNLSRIVITSFRTPNVTDMAYMFTNCKKLKSLNVKHFDTSNVTNMTSMFRGCETLQKLDVSRFSTAKVTDMGRMFEGCKNVTALDVSGFDTSLVGTMYAMFRGCEAVGALDVSGFTTGNVQNMASMFRDCAALTALDVSNFNTARVTDMNNMFKGCTNLTALATQGFDTANVTDMSYMFYGCSQLASADVGSFVTSKVKNMRGMFFECGELSEINVGNFSTANVTDFAYMFMGCKKVRELNVSGFETTNAVNLMFMFHTCESIDELNVSRFDTTSCENMQGMFYGCAGLSEIDVSGFSTDIVTDMSYMFGCCTKLTELNVSNFSTALVQDLRYMFMECPALTLIWCAPDANWIGDTITFSDDMFKNSAGLPGYDADYTDASRAKDSDLGGYFTANNKPVFRCQSLVLSGKIGINLYMDLSRLSEADRNAGYMTFSISGKGDCTESDDFDANDKNSTGKYYGFTCFVSSIQMADTITATYHYGEGKQVETTCSVEDYIRAADGILENDPAAFDATTAALIRALADYGYYLQPYLQSVRHWTNDPDTGYAAMTQYFTETFDFDEIGGALASPDRGIVRSCDPAKGVESVTFSLTFDSGTAINVYYTPADGLEGELAFEVLDGASNPLSTDAYRVERTDGQYRLVIDGIAGQNLDDLYDITASAAGETAASVRVCGLSYAKALLDKYQGEGDALPRNAAAAIFRYWEACEAYLSAHPNP